FWPVTQRTDCRHAGARRRLGIAGDGLEDRDLLVVVHPGGFLHRVIPSVCVGVFSRRVIRRSTRSPPLGGDPPLPARYCIVAVRKLIALLSKEPKHPALTDLVVLVLVLIVLPTLVLLVVLALGGDLPPFGGG